jgi:RimJ/RimL family protein N-acetyltransferase
MMAAPAGADDHVSFRPVRDADLAMLAEWLARPHWQEWWGDPVSELAYIRDMVEGRDSTRPFIFEIDGQAAGYIQVWDIGLHQTEEWARDNPWLMQLPAEAVGVDLSLADAAMLSKGFGSRVLRVFCETLRAEGKTTIIIDPGPANHRAVNAYRRAGFRPVPHLERTTTDVLIMQFQPGLGRP